MNRTRQLALSLAFNAVLALGVAWLVLRSPQPVGFPTAAGSGDTSKDETPPATPAITLTNTQLVTGPTVTRLVTNHFHWGRLESTDYHRYIENLREIGCPELTVRDIIIADLKRNAEMRKQALKGTDGIFSFWTTAEQLPGFALDQKQLQARFAEIDHETQQVAQQLLGLAWTELQPEALQIPTALDRQIAFLPQERQRQVREIRERFGETEEQYRKMSSSQQKYPDDTGIIARYEVMQTELRSVLSPVEFEQYEMSTSFTGDNLRKAMVGFHPTEAEFRLIYQQWRIRDEALPRIYFAGEADPGREPVFQAIRAELGDTRYEQYRALWWNHDYQELTRIEQANNLPAHTADWVNDYRKITEDRRTELNANPSLSPEQRSAYLNALAAETQAAITSALGEEGYTRYTRNQGRWINALSK